MINILYVDDEPINLQLFQLNFRKKYIVHTALSGDDGLSILSNENNIKVVISDMKMPGMNGLEFINKARQQFPAKFYFILTGYDINTEIMHAIENGVIIKYFSKPFNIKEIESTITEHCS